MKLIVCLACACVIGASATAGAKNLAEYVDEARIAREGGDLETAAGMMQEAIEAFPDSAIAYAYLGLYRGMQAGETDNMMEAGTLVSESFELLDKAVAMAPENLRARLYRGTMGVHVPIFFGRLEPSLEDLRIVTGVYEQSPDEVGIDIAVSAYKLSGEGYLKKKDRQRARQAWEKVIELAPGTPSAEDAASSIAKLAPAEPVAQPTPEANARAAAELQTRLETQPDDVDAMVALGKAHVESRRYEEAEKILRRAIELEPDNAGGYKWLAMAMGGMLDGELYDERIHEDTDWAANLAFEIAAHLDKAVELDPDDMESRLARGIAAVNFPFFIGKMEQGLADLEMALKSDLSEQQRAEAAYWLGFGYRKKGTAYWAKVITEYSDEEAARLVFTGTRPPLKRFDAGEYDRPAVAIDFLLGFIDQLPPQVAVWVERPNGEFVKTVYVSGFSGHVKERQVVLPVWASASRFADADAVTAASIDTGEHIYVWGLEDAEGNTVPAGEYVIKVETMFWPSNQYQMVEIAIGVGGAEKRARIEEGDLIPYLEVTYVP